MRVQAGQAVVQLVREVSRRQIAPRADHHERSRTFPAELFALLAELDLLGLPFDPVDGGGGHPATVVSQMLTELSQAYVAVGLGAAVHLLATELVADHAPEALRDDVLPRLVAGEWLASCPLAFVGTTPTSAARPAGPAGGWLLNGTVPGVTHAGDADCYVVFCALDDDGDDDVVALLVPADAQGLECLPDAGRLVCRDVRVPSTARLGTQGEGHEILLDAMASGRIGVAACAAGLARAALQVMVDVVRDVGAARETVTRMADLAAATEAAVALCQRAAAARDGARPTAALAAMAQLVATDTARSVVDHATQLVRDAGGALSGLVERYRRETMLLERTGGSRQLRRLAIAHDLLGTASDDER